MFIGVGLSFLSLDSSLHCFLPDYLCRTSVLKLALYCLVSVCLDGFIIYFDLVGFVFAFFYFLYDYFLSQIFLIVHNALLELD